MSRSGRASQIPVILTRWIWGEIGQGAGQDQEGRLLSLDGVNSYNACPIPVGPSGQWGIMGLSPERLSQSLRVLPHLFRR